MLTSIYFWHVSASKSKNHWLRNGAEEINQDESFLVLTFTIRKYFFFFLDADKNSGTSNPIVPSETKIFSSKKKLFRDLLLPDDDVKLCHDSKLK